MNNNAIDIQNKAPYIKSTYIFRRKPGEIKTYMKVWVDTDGKPVFQVLSYSLTDDVNYVKAIREERKGLDNYKVVKEFKDRFLIKSSIFISQETLELMFLADENFSEGLEDRILVVTHN